MSDPEDCSFDCLKIDGFSTDPASSPTKYTSGELDSDNADLSIVCFSTIVPNSVEDEPSSDFLQMDSGSSGISSFPAHQQIWPAARRDRSPPKSIYYKRFKGNPLQVLEEQKLCCDADPRFDTLMSEPFEKWNPTGPENHCEVDDDAKNGVCSRTNEDSVEPDEYSPGFWYTRYGVSDDELSPGFWYTRYGYTYPMRSACCQPLAAKPTSTGSDDEFSPGSDDELSPGFWYTRSSEKKLCPTVKSFLRLMWEGYLPVLPPQVL